MKTRYFLLGSLGLLSLKAHAQWALQPFSFPGYPQACASQLSAVDAQVAWAVGLDPASGHSAGQVAHTSNGGATWQLSALPTPATAIASITARPVYVSSNVPTGLAGLSATTALVCIAPELGGAGSYVLQTTDGGNSWTQRTTARQFASATSHANFIAFFTATEGICVGDPDATTGRFEVYRTTDAGTTWAALPSAALPPARPAETGLAGGFARLGSSAWFSTTAGRVFRTADGGQTWAVGNLGLPNASALSFTDVRSGLAYDASAGGLASTADGGASWQLVPHRGPLHALVAAVPGTSAYLSAGAGADAGSSLSSDNGLTWTALETTRHHVALSLASATGAWSGAQSSDALPTGLGAYKLVGNALGVQLRAAGGGLGVYPNPSTTGQFVLTLTLGATTTPVHVVVLDALGRCVYTTTLAPAAAPTIELDLSRQAPGAYTVQVSGSTGSSQRRIVVE